MLALVGISKDEAHRCEQIAKVDEGVFQSYVASIESASPGARLERFGRSPVPGRVVWGNEIARKGFAAGVAKLAARVARRSRARSQAYRAHVTDVMHAHCAVQTGARSCARIRATERVRVDKRGDDR